MAGILPLSHGHFSLVGSKIRSRNVSRVLDRCVRWYLVSQAVARPHPRSRAARCESQINQTKLDPDRMVLGSRPLHGQGGPGSIAYIDSSTRRSQTHLRLRDTRENFLWSWPGGATGGSAGGSRPHHEVCDFTRAGGSNRRVFVYFPEF